MPRPAARSASGDSEQSNREKLIAPRKAKQKKPPPEEVPSDEDEEVGENGEEEADYVVEDIRSHFWEKNVLKFEVKWEGWDDDDNTWEPKENLEEAHEALNAYIERIGGWPQKSKPNSGKKRGRRSTGNAVDAMQEGKRARLERNSKAAPSSDEEPAEIPWPKTKTSAWQPPKPKPGSPGNWEEMLLRIETVMVEADGSKWAYLLWTAEDDDGKRITTRALLPSVYVAAPQAMLKFYESHLVFTNPGEKNHQAPGEHVKTKSEPEPEPAETDDDIED